jgi:hypothetical protein
MHTEMYSSHDVKHVPGHEIQRPNPEAARNSNQQLRTSQYENDKVCRREQIHSYNMSSWDGCFNIGMKIYSGIAVRYVIMFLFVESSIVTPQEI